MKAITLAQQLITLRDQLAKNPIVVESPEFLKVYSLGTGANSIYIHEGASMKEINDLIFDVRSYGFHVDTHKLPESLTFIVEYKPLHPKRVVSIDRMAQPYGWRNIIYPYVVNFFQAEDAPDSYLSGVFASSLYSSLFKARPENIANISTYSSQYSGGTPLVIFTPNYLQIAPTTVFNSSELDSLKSDLLEYNPFVY